MTSPQAASPLRYDPSVEQSEPDEAQTTERLNRMLHYIQKTTFADYGHAQRSVHAKSHGLIEAELQVMDGLPEDLAQGLFARPARYPVIMRISAIPGDVLDDSVVVPVGLALKVIGVEGERLPGSEGTTTQDFLMVNAPAFGAPNLKSFAVAQAVLTATTDTGQAWKKAFSASLRGFETALEAVGGGSPGLKSLGGPPSHPLGETFFTQTPYRYGAYVAKLSVAPVSPGLRALTGKPIDVRKRPNALREEVIDALRHEGGEWELRVQLRTDARTMPVEDSTVVWSEDQSPYRVVARIKAGPQPAWSEARAWQVDDGLSFAPWHGLAAHQPLGSINRARKSAYPRAARFREEHNNHPIKEPATALSLSNEPACPYGFAPGREGRRPNTPDAREDKWGQPLNPTARRIVAGAAGGLAAGLLVSAEKLATDATRDDRNRMRQTTVRDDRGHGEQTRTATGQKALACVSHLGFSALAGAAYGLLNRHDRAPVAAGLVFGVGAYALAHGIVGPVPDATPDLTDERPRPLKRQGVLGAVFGVATAIATRQLNRRL